MTDEGILWKSSNVFWDFNLPKDTILIIWHTREEGKFGMFSLFDNMQEMIDKMKQWN